MNSRRNFLKIGSLAVAGGLIFGSKDIFSKTSNIENYFSIPTEIHSNYSLGCESFKPLINTIFEIKKEGLIKTESKNVPKVSLRLIEVNNRSYNKIRLNGKFSDGFSLIFQVENRKTLKDKIYQISHPQTGEFPLFISTVGRSGKRYQAVFSRANI